MLFSPFSENVNYDSEKFLLPYFKTHLSDFNRHYWIMSCLNWTVYHNNVLATLGAKENGTGIDVIVTDTFHKVIICVT